MEVKCPYCEGSLSVEVLIRGEDPESSAMSMAQKLVTYVRLLPEFWPQKLRNLSLKDCPDPDESLVSVKSLDEA